MRIDLQESLKVYNSTLPKSERMTVNEFVSNMQYTSFKTWIRALNYIKRFNADETAYFKHNNIWYVVII